MSAILDLILDLLFPPKCMLCGKLLKKEEQTLCRECANSDLPEFSGKTREVPFFEECVAPFFYETPISDAIQKMKFHGMQTYAEQFAAWMAVPVRDKLAGKYDVISWVPCSRRRVWTRGFDQAKMLAQALAKNLDEEAVCTLKKVRHTPKQSKTANAAARRANVLGAYRAIDPDALKGKRILVIDDVVTTGATLSECGKVLKIAGAGPLVCAVIAATHREKE